jgi:hypothetical protein
MSYHVAASLHKGILARASVSFLSNFKKVKQLKLYHKFTTRCLSDRVKLERARICGKGTSHTYG